MHQALIAITLIAGQAYLEESQITSLADLEPKKDIVITAEDLSPDADNLDVSADSEEVATEEGMENFMPDAVEVDDKSIEFDKTSEKSDFAEIIPDNETKKEEVGITDTIAGADEKIKEVVTETAEKAKELVSDEKKTDVSDIG